MNREGRSCATCTKAYLVAETLAGVTLECRALPPVQDVARFSRFPLVRPDDFCHDNFQRDAEADAQPEKTR